MVFKKHISILLITAMAMLGISISAWSGTYVDDFNDGKPDGWEIVGGTWKIKDGGYHGNEPADAHGKADQRGQDWLVRYLTQPLKDTPRNARYLAYMNRLLEARPLDLDIGAIDKNSDRTLTWIKLNAIGQLAFCYRTPGLKGHGDAHVLERLRQAMLKVAENVDAEGRFWPELWRKVGYTSLGSHEHVWRLEVFLLAYVLVGDGFPAAGRQTIEAALRRAAEFTFKNPTTQTNNRGMVWCAGMTLCGVYFDNQAYLDLARTHAGRILSSLLYEDGEVGEHTAQYGGGPDANYTYTGWAYVYLYRLLSGEKEMEPRFHQSARWLALYNTLSACPIVSGASVRRRHCNPGNFWEILPTFEQLSKSEPFFATLANHALKKKERIFPSVGTESGMTGFGGHAVSPVVWALLEGGADAKQGDLPDWFVNHTQGYERPEVHYALVNRHYQTGVTFRGRTLAPYSFDLRGMQTFAFGDEYPILLHTDTVGSTTLADGIDAAAVNVDKGPGGWEVVLMKGKRLEKWRGELATIVERRRNLWSIYAYTPLSALAVYGGAKGEIRNRWVMNRSFVSKPTLDAARRTVLFEGRKGQIYFLAGQPRLWDPGDKDGAAATLEVVNPAPISVFAFSNDTFHFEGYDAAGEEVTFSDASGRYRLSVKDVLAKDGQINRTAPMRLVLRGKE